MPELAPDDDTLTADLHMLESFGVSPLHFSTNARFIKYLKELQVLRAGKREEAAAQLLEKEKK